MNILFSTAYFGPVQYYLYIFSANKVFIEGMEHYPKQTYRNRCVIYGANGPLTLTVPVTRGIFPKTLTKEIKIDYSCNWQKNHLKAIESAYRNSPYFEYYIDEIIRFFNQRFDFLIDYNNEILLKTCEIIGLPINLSNTEVFQKTLPNDCIDIRFNINPKKQNPINGQSINLPVYRQVFGPKTGFIEDLSVMDLIFNTGPDAINYLR
jgi:hypothetical protein